MSQLDYSTFEKPQLVALLLEKDEVLEKTERLLSTVDKVITNKNQSFSDRVQTASILLGHPQEVLNGQPFVLNVEQERKRSGLSNKSAATYFQAMTEAGGIEYSVDRKKKTASDGSKIHVSESTIRFTDSFDVVDTKATSTKEKIKDDEKERREARIQKLRTPICPSCHSDEHIHFATIPYCQKCEIQFDNEEQHFPANQLCSVIEDPEAETLAPPAPPVITICQECGFNPEELDLPIKIVDGFCEFCHIKGVAVA